MFLLCYFTHLVDLTRASAILCIASIRGSPVEQVFRAPAFGRTCHSVKGKLLRMRTGPLLENPVTLLVPRPLYQLPGVFTARIDGLGEVQLQIR